MSDRDVRYPPSGSWASNHAFDRWVEAVLADLASPPLHTFFEQFPGTLWATDAALTLTFVDGLYIRRVGIDPNKLTGRTLTDLLLDGREDHPMIQGHITALAGHENSVRIEWGGEVLSARIAPLRNGNGDVIGCVGITQPIGWVPDDDGTLRESDVRLRRVIDSNMIGIVFGNAEGAITDANEAFLHLIGYTREDLVADQISWPSLTTIESHTRQLEALAELASTGRCSPFETEIIRKDGVRVWVLIGAARLSAQRREGVAWVLDISERRRTKRRLEAELACASVLIGARAIEDAAPEILRVVCDGLEWATAALWTRVDDGVRPIASHGASVDDIRTTTPLAWSAVMTRVRTWSADGRSMAVPIVAGDRDHGVLTVSSHRGAAPDSQLVDAVEGIAAHIGTLFARTS